MSILLDLLEHYCYLRVEVRLTLAILLAQSLEHNRTLRVEQFTVADR